MSWGLGGWMHRGDAHQPFARAMRLLPTATSGTPTAAKASPPSPPLSDLATRDRTNRRLLELCVLSDADRAYLTGPDCGHAPEALDGAYGTLPARGRSAAILATLAQEFGPDVLLTVPGIVERKGRLEFSITTGGLLVAVRDAHGLIQGFQVRQGGSMYLWLSGGGGPSTGTPCHVARPHERRAYRVYVVESPKTANILAERLGAVVVATAGMANRAAALDTLQQLQEEEGVDTLVVAFDAVKPDANDPAKVERLTAETERNRRGLAAAAHALGDAVWIARWDHADGKGPDDVTLAGHNWVLEMCRPTADATAPSVAGDDGADGANEPQEAQPPHYGVPTLAEARALRHETLARKHVKVAERLYAATTYLDLIGRVSKHSAVITPAQDPTAKRTRPVLSPTDRMCGVNTILGVRTAHKGALSTRPVALYRAAIAANGTSDATVTSSMKQLARVGVLAQAADDDDEGRHLYALPALMPGEIPADTVLTFDCPRRTKERHRPCASCGGTEFTRTTRTRVTCIECGEIVTDKTHTVTVSDHDDDAAGDAAGDGREPTTSTPPLANCDTYVTETDGEQGDADHRDGKLSVAICEGGRPRPDVPRAPFSARRQARIGDRAAAHGHRASDDRAPRPVSEDDDEDAAAMGVDVAWEEGIV